MTAEAIEIGLAVGLAGLSIQWNPRACLDVALVALAVAMRVFGVTVGKVLLVDLADVDQAVPVVFLLALGMAMIGGAYWYIRSRRGKL